MNHDLATAPAPTPEAVLTPNLVQQPPVLDLNRFIPIVEGLVANQAREIALKEVAQAADAAADERRDHLEAEEHKLRLEFERHRFNWTFVGGAAVALVFLGFAAGFFFWKNDHQMGMTILSHVGAVCAGWIAGLGLGMKSRARSRDEGDD